MARVTKELQRQLFDAGVYPPRHQRGCPKNYARTMPLPLAAMGLTVEEIKARVQSEYEKLPCECSDDVIHEW
jgi:hypothetical protein